MSSGAYKYAALLPAGLREALLRAGTLLYYSEGAAATVSVRRMAGTTSLAIDGKVDASNGGDMLTQRLLAHAAAAAAPEAQARRHHRPRQRRHARAARCTHPIERADVIEISPEVVEASALLRRARTSDALRDPRTRLARRRRPDTPACSARDAL